MDKIFCSTVWFSTAHEQRNFAIAKGVNPKNIYTKGDGAEGFDAFIASFRGQPGRVGLVGGLYILGQSSDKLRERLAVLRKHSLVPFDFETGETDGAKLYATAMGSILGNKTFKGNKKKHKRLSAKGGVAKLETYREGRLAEEVAGPIWAAEELLIERRLELMNPKGVKKNWTEASARRHLDQYRKK